MKELMNVNREERDIYGREERICGDRERERRYTCPYLRPLSSQIICVCVC